MKQNIMKFAMVPWLFIICLNGTALGADFPVPNPHDFFNSKTDCQECHSLNEKTGRMMDHSFVKDVTSICRQCHSTESLGYSHSIGARPEEKYPDMDVPEVLPLDVEGALTCGTCHNPHLPYFTMDRFFSIQDPLFCALDAEPEPDTEIVLAMAAEPEPEDANGAETKCFYQTYFLRVREIDQGNDPTCRSCHVN